MNIRITNYEDLVNEFSSDTNFEKRKKTADSGDAPSSRKFSRRKGPKQFNGIHRRRTKKIKW